MATKARPFSPTLQASNIGRGIGTQTYVVSTDSTKLAGIGSRGELWLRGPLVSEEGYLNSPDKNAAVFNSNPLWLQSIVPPEDDACQAWRCYRTGDLVSYDSWTNDGSLIFHGRVDDQVKVRGQRVSVTPRTWKASNVPRILRRALT